MLRVPFKLDYRRLNLRCDILQPTTEKLATRNTKGLFKVVATRWFGWIDLSGIDQDLNFQDSSTTKKRILIRRDDTIQPGWAIRYPADSSGSAYQITDITVFEEADRRFTSAVVMLRNSLTTIAP